MRAITKYEVEEKTTKHAAKKKKKNGRKPFSSSKDPPLARCPYGADTTECMKIHFYVFLQQGYILPQLWNKNS